MASNWDWSVQNHGVHYLLTADYFLRYPEVTKLTSTTSVAVIWALKSVFSQHGIPETVRGDNAPQYSSQEFAWFAKSYEFNHVTNSPRFPQSSGQVVWTVQTVRRGQMIPIWLCWAIVQHRCHGVTSVLHNWAWEEGFKHLSHKPTSCWCQIGSTWRHSMKRTNSSNSLRRATLTNIIEPES